VIRFAGLPELLFLATLAACDKRATRDAPASQQEPRTKASAAAPAVMPPSAVESPRASGPPPPCRALRVRGLSRTDAGEAIATMAPLDGVSWVTLEADAEMVIRFPASARELSVSGPGRFLPCRSGMELVLLSSGTFRSSRGTGVRPGAEVWVATPFGSLRYGDADLEVIVEARKIQVHVRGGSIVVDPAPGSGALPEGSLTGPNGRASGSGQPNPEGLASACTLAAKEAGKLALSIVNRPVDAGLGERAALQLRSRRRARAACNTARAGLDRELAASRRGRLGDQIAAAETLWRAVPAGKQHDPE
jgi:hypothetical protein